MTNIEDIQDDFFFALRHKNWEGCQNIITKCHESVDESLAGWCHYFSGILANEKDKNFAEAEQIFEAVLQTEPPPYLKRKTLFALSRTYEYLGRWEQAINIHQQCLSLLDQTKEAQEYAQVLNAIAVSQTKGFDQGRFGVVAIQEAISHCQEALTLLTSLDDDRSLEIRSYIFNTLALLAQKEDRFDDALAFYEQALAICSQRNDPEGKAITIGNIGEVYQLRATKDVAKALAAYKQSLELFGKLDDPALRIEILADLGSLYQLTGRFERALDYYVQAIEIVEALRAGNTNGQARAEFFATVTTLYAHVINLSIQTDQTAQAFHFSERARARAFLDMMAIQSAELPRATGTSILTLETIQQNLSPDSLLVSYFTMGLIDTRSGNKQIKPHRFPPEKILIFAITKQHFEIFDAQISPNDLQPASLDSVVERHYLGGNMRRILYDKFVSPIDSLVRSHQRLIIVPHGPLHYIPFQALLAPDGQTLHRVDGPLIAYTPSASILFRHAQPAISTTNGLAVGFNGSGPRSLHSAETVVREIADIIEGTFVISPSKNELLAEATGKRYLHFACHGDFKPSNPLASALYISENDTLTVSDVFEKLKLNSELVVLSACESGLSTVRRGDELDGFARGFLFAGSTHLATTLWRVYDNPTRLLMRQFYTNLREGYEPAAALHHAQIYLQQLTYQEAAELLDVELFENLPPKDPQTAVFADPQFWAAFVLIISRPPSRKQP